MAQTYNILNRTVVLFCFVLFWMEIRIPVRLFLSMFSRNRSSIHVNLFIKLTVIFWYFELNYRNCLKIKKH